MHVLTPATSQFSAENPLLKPSTPTAEPPASFTNGLAVASLVLAILWGFGILAVVAIVLGVKARRQIAERGEDGSGLALGGIVLGSIGVLVASVLAFSAITGGGGDSAITAACKAETSALHDAEDAYKAMTRQYGDHTELEVTGLHPPPKYHSITMEPDRMYVIRVADSRCGVPGHRVGETPTDY